MILPEAHQRALSSEAAMKVATTQWVDGLEKAYRAAQTGEHALAQTFVHEAQAALLRAMRYLGEAEAALAEIAA